MRRNCVAPPFSEEEKWEEQNFLEALSMDFGQETCRGDPGFARGDLPLESKFLEWLPKHQAQRTNIPEVTDWLPIPVFLGCPGGPDGKESTYNTGDLGLIPGVGRSHGEGNSYPLQHSGLENSTDKGAWQAIVHGVTKGQTSLSHFHIQIDCSSQGAGRQK